MLKLKLPFVKPCQLVLALFVPLTPPFKVVLIVESTAYGASARQSLGDVFPLHATSPELDDEAVLLLRPFALLFHGLIRC